MAVNRQDGQIQISNTIERRGAIGDVPASGYADAARAISGNLAQVSQRIGALADHAAAVEGKDAGRLAGLDPEFRPSKSLTIRGEAYDAAGLQVYETRARQQLNADLEALYDKHSGSPDDLAQALSKKRVSFLSTIPDDLRPDLQTSFDGAALTMSRKALRLKLERDRGEQWAALNSEVEQGLSGLYEQASELGLDGMADQRIGAEMKRLEGVLGRTDPAGQRLISPKQAADIMVKARDRVEQARVLGTFSRLPGLKAQRQFLADIEGDGDLPADDPPETEDDVRDFEDGIPDGDERTREDILTSRAPLPQPMFLGGPKEADNNEEAAPEAAPEAQSRQRIATAVRAELRAAAVRDSVAARALAGEVGWAVKMMHKGLPIPEERMFTLRGALSSVSGPRSEALTRKLDQAQDVLAFFRLSCVAQASKNADPNPNTNTDCAASLRENRGSPPGSPNRVFSRRAAHGICAVTPETPVPSPMPRDC
jgi:hypothetical protein